MNAKTMAAQTNANHFGHPKTNHDETAPGKPRPVAPPNFPSEKTSEIGSHQPESRHEKTADTTGSNSGSGVSDDVQKETAFRLDAPAAKKVLLAGDFTGWDKSPVRMIKGGGGLWHAKVSLAPGRHLYRFLVDDEWQDDPNQSGREANLFGTFNNVVEIS